MTEAEDWEKSKKFLWWPQNLMKAVLFGVHWIGHRLLVFRSYWAL